MPDLPSDEEIQLLAFLDNHFDNDELAELCFELGVDFGHLEGANKRSKARALIQYCQRRGCFQDLLERARRARPGISFGQSAAPPALPPPISLNHHYLCYAPREGGAQARRLHEALRQAGARPWLDQVDTPAGYDPEAAREDALRECATLLLVLTPASAAVQSESAREWRRALQYKKPIIVVSFAPGVELPLMLGNRPVLDFSASFDTSLAGLRRYLDELNTPAGQLRELEYRLADAERELRGATAEQRMRVERDIAQLEKEISTQRAIARDPEAAARAAEQRTAAAIERERQPERPAGGRAQSKFINPPPLIAPTYFQDRHNENGLIAEFLRDPARRMLTVVGRGGVGKTAMVCRLLKALESGQLPDDLGSLAVGGIVYLSAVGSRWVSFPNLHADLLRLLPAERAQPIEALYKDPQRSVAAKLAPVWEAFAELMTRPVVVLLDNLEDLIDPQTHAIADTELDAALRALLEAPPHPVKLLLTTRVAPREILLLHPERQMPVPLDAGLPEEYAVHVLRAGDPSGALGLKSAPDSRLTPACTFTRGFPRALEALTAALNADRAATLEDLLSGPPPANVVEALVGQAYSRLDPLAQKVMQGLAIFGRPVPPAAVDYLLQPQLPGLDSTPVLNRLVNIRFVTREQGRYYMHPVDREYALQRLTVETRGQGDKGTGGQENPVALLQSRAADYFRETRSPRDEWKSLADLAPQLAEIDLRYAAGEYDSAADVLTDIDFDYLLLWGHYWLLIEQHERLQRRLSDSRLKCSSVGNLGTAYSEIGQTKKAIACQEQALALAQEEKDKWGEGVWLGNLGNRYAAVGETRRAIEYYEQALSIAREIGNRRGEESQLGNLGNRYAELGETHRAIEYYEQTLVIAREIGDRSGEGTALVNLAEALIDDDRYTEAIQHAQQEIHIGEEINEPAAGSYGYGNLALAQLYAGDLPAARAAAEQARKFDYPLNNHNVLALLGVIARRQNDNAAAQDAFRAALAHAEDLLAQTPELYDAMYAKALALAGLGDIAAARVAYRAARAVNSEAGIVRRATRLLGQLDGAPRFWEE